MLTMASLVTTSATRIGRGVQSDAGRGSANLPERAQRDVQTRSAVRELDSVPPEGERARDGYAEFGRMLALPLAKSAIVIPGTSRRPGRAGEARRPSPRRPRLSFAAATRSSASGSREGRSCRRPADQRCIEVARSGDEGRLDGAHRIAIGAGATSARSATKSVRSSRQNIRGRADQDGRM